MKSFLLLLAGLLCAVAACAEEVESRTSLPSDNDATAHFYRNEGYEYSLYIPQGVRNCVGQVTDHGTWLSLEPEVGCDERSPTRRYMGVAAEYASWVVDGLESLRDQAIFADIRWLRHERLADRRAEGCRIVHIDGDIEVRLVAFRMEEPGSPWPLIEHRAYVRSTPEHFEADYAFFRKLLDGLWIHPDGPVDGVIRVRQPKAVTRAKTSPAR
jgi:hypothetical protein